MQDQEFRRVQAIHPHWTGALVLSNVDNTLIHETHGSRGTYLLSGGTLSVAWDKFPPEEFVEIGGIYVHVALAPNVGQTKSRTTERSRLVPSGEDRLPIHVISLRRTPDRRQRFAVLNQGINFEFFDAVDGSTVDRAEFFSGMAEAGTPYSLGAIGCALSHLALWEMSIQEQTPLTIVEDDAILRHDFEKASRDVVARLPADWDLIMWGWNFDSILSIIAMPGISRMVVLCDQDSLRNSIAAFRSTPLEIRTFRLDKCLGTCAYSISPAGSRKFKEMCFPLKNEAVRFPILRTAIKNNGIDIAMNCVYATTNSYVSLPPLAITPNINSESLTLLEK